MKGQADVVRQECTGGHGWAVMCRYVFCTFGKSAFVGEVMIDNKACVW